MGRGGADLRQQDRCRALMHAAGAGTSPAGALSHNQPCLKALARLGFLKRPAPQELCLCSCLPGASLDQTVVPGLPRELRVTWGALDCDAFWPHAAGARTVEAGAGAWREDTARGQDFCAKPCTDSWSEGAWAQHCAPGRECAWNFVPKGQDCMYEIFSSRTTAACLQDRWLLVLGSSGAMNLALAWMQALDSVGTAPPFDGPRWYNWTCFGQGSCKGEHAGLSFVNYKNMKIDMVFDARGRVLWKGGRGVPLEEAPEVPLGGWRLTALPVQWAVEVTATVASALPRSRFVRWNGGPDVSPLVYVQIGQWHLNAFDGKSVKWLRKGTQWGINATELYAWARVPSPAALTTAFRGEIANMTQRLRALGVGSLALAGMPVSGHACSKKQGLGCRGMLNDVIRGVVADVRGERRRQKPGHVAPGADAQQASAQRGRRAGDIRGTHAAHAAHAAQRGRPSAPPVSPALEIRGTGLRRRVSPARRLLQQLQLATETGRRRVLEAGQSEARGPSGGLVFYVEWDSVSSGEQAAAHTNQKASVLGIQRLLSVLCAPRRHAVDHSTQTFSSRHAIRSAQLLTKEAKEAARARAQQARASKKTERQKVLGQKRSGQKLDRSLLWTEPLEGGRPPSVLSVGGVGARRAGPHEGSRLGRKRIRTRRKERGSARWEQEDREGAGEMEEEENVYYKDTHGRGQRVDAEGQGQGARCARMISFGYACGNAMGFGGDGWRDVVGRKCAWRAEVYAQDAVAQAIRGAHAVTNQRRRRPTLPGSLGSTPAPVQLVRVVLRNHDQGLLWVWHACLTLLGVSVCLCFLLRHHDLALGRRGMQRGKVKVDGEAEAKRCEEGAGSEATVPPEWNGPATAVLGHSVALRDRGMVGGGAPALGAPSTGLSATRENQRGRESQRGHSHGVLATVSADKGDGGAGGGRLEAFGCARLLASLHVAATHLSRLNHGALRGGAGSAPYWLGWGYTWVPWFLMLSAFILTYSSMTKGGSACTSSGAARKSAWAEAAEFVYKRSAGIYPLYVVSVVVALALMLAAGTVQSEARPSAIFAQLLLVQAWLPSECEHTVQAHCWFLSAIIPCWALHPQLLRSLARWQTHSLCVLLAAIAALPWLCLVALPLGLGVPYPYDWYANHHWQASGKWRDIAVITLKFHPLCYLHLYVAGMALALVYVRAASAARSAPARLPWLVRHGAVVGCAGLLLVFTQPVLRPPAHKLLCRLGGLAPLHALLLVGLAVGNDPFARLLRHPWLQAVGSYSYGVYIWQYHALALWVRGDGPLGLGYWAVLLAVSILGTHYIQQPAARHYECCLRWLATAALVALMLASSVPQVPWVSLVRAVIPATTAARAVPDALVYAGGVLDMRLRMRSSLAQQLLHVVQVV